VTGFEPLGEKRFSATLSDQIQHITTRDRTEGRHRSVVRHPRLVLHHHEDDEQVIDLRQRDERRVEESDGEEPRAAE
jgi:hypothetical protein